MLPDSSPEKVLFAIDKAFLMIACERWAIVRCCICYDISHHMVAHFS
jgi:hypothetical protein